MQRTLRGKKATAMSLRRPSNTRPATADRRAVRGGRKTDRRPPQIPEPAPPRRARRARKRSAAHAVGSDRVARPARRARRSQRPADLEQLGQRAAEAVQTACSPIPGSSRSACSFNDGKVTAQDGKVRFELAMQVDRSPISRALAHQAFLRGARHQHARAVEDAPAREARAPREAARADEHIQQPVVERARHDGTTSRDRCWPAARCLRSARAPCGQHRRLEQVDIRHVGQQAALQHRVVAGHASISRNQTCRTLRRLRLARGIGSTERNSNGRSRDQHAAPARQRVQMFRSGPRGRARFRGWHDLRRRRPGARARLPAPGTMPTCGRSAGRAGWPRRGGSRSCRRRGCDRPRRRWAR